MRLGPCTPARVQGVGGTPARTQSVAGTLAGMQRVAEAEVRFAAGVPNVGPFGDPLLLTDLAVAGEDSGWDAFFIWDHLLYRTSAGRSPTRR